MTHRIGEQLGRYRLVRLLGQGSFADVYLGEHLYLKTQAAVKVLRTHLTDADAAGFLTEAQTIARLVHPHIIRIFDYDVQEGTPYLVMDYAPNGSLRQRHPRHNPIPLNLVVYYVKQIADALQYAHEQRLIHRDVKPENVLLGRRNEILLSDFGIVQQAQTTGLEVTQKIVGTMAYMAPEQLQGKPRIASDQYALGIMTYEWLAGERPFEGGLSEMASQHLFTPPPPMHEKDPSIAPAVEKVVMTTLAKDAQQRFASVGAFANALEQASGSASPPPRSNAVILEPPTLLLQPAVPDALPVTETASARKPLPTPVIPISISSLPTPPDATPPPFPAQLDTSAPAYSAIRPGHRYSRRTVLIGLVGLAGLTAAGTAGLALSRGGLFLFQGPKVSTPSPPSLGTTLYTYRGHSNLVNMVVWSPDGTRIASSSLDGTVQVWDAANGRQVYTYRGHSSGVTGAVWSPDGKHIASSSLDGTVQVWDAANGRQVYTYRGHSSGVTGAAWSPDGKRIASSSLDGTVQVWNAADGGHVFVYRGHTYQRHAYGVTAVAWSHDGTRIASGSQDKTVQVWDVANGGHVFVYRGHSRGVTAVAWSPDGTRIASGSVDLTVQVWDAADGGHVYTYARHASSLTAVAWSPDGKRIASGSYDWTVQVWNAADGGHVFVYRRHSRGVTAVAWSPDGKRIASGSKDTTVQIWVAS